jgi:hypothetical protein
MLRPYVSYRQDDWCEKLAYLEFAYNNAKNKTTGQTPFLLNCGEEPLEFSDLLFQKGAKYSSQYFRLCRTYARSCTGSISHH